MTDKPDMQVIEINGVKLEVDMRTARRVDQLQVGSRVKLLIKNYSNYAAYPGVVVGFEPFPDRPTIIVAYIDASFSKAEPKIAHFHKDSEDVQLVPAVDDDFSVTRAEVLSWFDREDARLSRERDELAAKRRFFVDRFKAYWQDIDEAVTEPQPNI